MSSILADIDTTLENNGEDWLALHYLICYFGYCNDEHLPEFESPERLMSSLAFIELPDKYLLRLDHLGLIKRARDYSTAIPSVYFYDRTDWHSPRILHELLYQYKLDQRVLDEYVKFHNMPQEYKTEAIKNFLHEMQDYINGILQKYYDDLAKCC
jgi:hypothetical protein